MRKTTPAHFLALALVGLVSASAQAGWLDDLQKKLGDFQSAPSATGGVTAALSDEEVVRGLKEDCWRKACRCD